MLSHRECISHMGVTRRNNRPPQLACKLTHFRSHDCCMANKSKSFQIT